MAKILVVDDQDSVRQIVSAVLRAGGHQTVTASDGNSALQLLREPEVNLVELVIADMLMPQKDGLATINDIRQEFPGVRLIAMSGGGSGPAKSSAPLAAARYVGVEGILYKPFSPTALIDAVQRALAAVLRR